MERVLSAYRDRFVKDNTYFYRAYGRIIIKRYRPNPTKQALEIGSGVTFPEVTKYVIERRMRKEHRQAFDKLCHPCAVNYDFIGRFENLFEDARYLIKKRQELTTAFLRICFVRLTPPLPYYITILKFLSKEFFKWQRFMKVTMNCLVILFQANWEHL